MSFDDYARYISQKHRLCIAIAILRAKPQNLTTEQYIDILKCKIDDGNDDLDVTMCSDDFILDDDLTDISETILKDLNLDEDGGKMLCDDDDGSRTTCEEVKRTHSPKSLNVNLLNEASQTQIFTQNDKDIDNNATYCEESQDIINAISKQELNKEINTNKRLDANKSFTYGSQKTIIYTVHGFTQNCTHYSPSQNNLTIPQKFIHRASVSKNFNQTDPNLPIERSDGKQAETTNDDLSNGQNIPLTHTRNNIEEINSISETVNSEQDENIYLKNIAEYFSDLNEIPEEVDVRFPEDLEFEQILNQAEQNADNIVQYSQNLDKYFIESGKVKNTIFSQDIGDNFKTNDLELQNTPQNGQILDFSDAQISDQTSKVLKVHTDSLLNLTSYNEDIILNTNLNNDIDNPNTAESYPKEIDIVSSNNLIAEHTTVFNPSNSNLSLNQNIDNSKTADPRMSTEDMDTNQMDTENVTSQEVIPFKVLTEFSQVKAFLSKRERRMSEGYSTDSGYRSDSQGRSSNKSVAQLSRSQLNQAAHSLLDHITSCPLAGNTRDITTEIAEVLGQLIDKLHEQETYPSFLEELLETVAVLLRELHEEGSSLDDVLLKKDELTQRLVLLNKSVHIQRFSIEKLTHILATYHSNLTQHDTIYELSNIDQMDNLQYTFHLLEILLKNYVTNKDVLSQNTQSLTQGEDLALFKKSEISDIWKRKWNPKHQTENEGSRAKKCVLTDLGDALNKIIVDCMNGYSLISYAALQCFNLLQS